MKSQKKHPEEMTAAELERATKQFDQPFVFEKTRAMNATERAEERRMRRRHAPRAVAEKKITISLDGNSLRKADALAKSRGINRSELIASFVLAGLRRRAS